MLNTYVERYRNIYISFYSICESLSSLERSRTKISLPPLLLNSKNNKVKFCYRGGIDDKDDETDMSKKKRKEKKKGKSDIRGGKRTINERSDEESSVQII